MFYSHEILTQRKYGVATIWLVATLGSKSNLRKVHRKDILGVNVPKACETVMQPDAPLALRLQSNLLYGISRVYSGQCDYLIYDASMAHANIKRLITATIKARDLDLNSSGKARPEHLVLADDPAFLLDLNFRELPDGIDITMAEADTSFTLDDTLGISSLQVDGASSANPFHHVSTHANSSPPTFRSNLGIASSSTAAGDYGFLSGPGPAQEEGRFLDDVDFEFDANGEIREIATPQIPAPNRDRDSLFGRTGSAGPSRMGKAGSVHSIGRGSRMNSEEAAAQVLREHEEGRDGSYNISHAFDGDNDLYAPPENSQFDILDSAEPFPDRTQGSPVPRESKDLSKEAKTDCSEAEANTRARKKHSSRSIIVIDAKTELRNADLKEWRDNYLDNMEAALKRSQAGRVARNAKGKANILIFEFGFFGKLRNPILKNLFSPKALLETINKDIERYTADAAGNRKRKRAVKISDAEGEEQQLDGEDEEGRRTRIRNEELQEAEAEMGLSNLADEYELPMHPRDDLGEEDLEIGREAVAGISDSVRPSSQPTLPWNIPSTLQNKSRAGSLMSGGIMLPSFGGFPSSSMGGSQIGQTDFTSRRLSAMRGGMERLSVLGLPIGERDEEALEDLNQEFPVGGAEMDFEYFGAGANVDTQTAQDSQWLAATVEQESANFFEFLKTEHVKLNQQVEDEGREPANFITFEQLLSPAKNGRIVAAQAFHHTLLLATKGLVYVSQEENYGSIQISIM